VSAEQELGHGFFGHFVGELQLVAVGADLGLTKDKAYLFKGLGELFTHLLYLVQRCSKGLHFWNYGILSTRRVTKFVTNDRQTVQYQSNS
jgi:hypothetical protein